MNKGLSMVRQKFGEIERDEFKRDKRGILHTSK